MSALIGLLWPQTASVWTAGDMYFDNLLRSVELAGHSSDVVILEPESGAHSKRGECRAPIVTWPGDGTGRGDPSIVRRFVRRRLGIEHESVAAAVRRSAVSCVFGDASLMTRFPVPWVGWIPDFQHLDAPQYFDAQEIEARDSRYRRLSELARSVLVSSEDVARAFARFAPDLAYKARVAPFVSLLPDSFYESDAAPIVAKYNVGDQYVVVPNQWWRHKNHEVAIRAAAVLRDEGVDTHWVFTGALADYRNPSHISDLLQLVAQLGLGPHVSILGNLARGEQLQLMRAAACIVQPSLFEGWSTVVEDAKTLGQRLVVSDIPVHREQDPAAALFFDPHSPTGLASRIQEVLAGAVERVDENVARQLSRQRGASFGERFVSIMREAAG